MLSNLYSKNHFCVSVLMSRKRQVYNQESGEIYEAGNFDPKDIFKTFGISSLSAVLRSMVWLYNRKHDPKIWIMSHPFDIPLRVITRLMPGKNFSLIHEYTRHSGEFWPPRLISRLNVSLADSVIALSRYVGDEIFRNHEGAKPILLPHPILNISSDPNLSPMIPEKYFLFIGRIRTYKGLDTLRDAWAMLTDEPALSNWTLVIAGEGKLPKTVWDLKKTIIINRWLEDAEVQNLVQFTNCIILPYRDASQSGILALQESKKVVKIVFAEGGLTEQLDNLMIKIHNGDSKKLANAMLSIIRNPSLKTSSVREVDNLNWELKWLSLLD